MQKVKRQSINSPPFLLFLFLFFPFFFFFFFFFFLLFSFPFFFFLLPSCCWPKKQTPLSCFFFFPSSPGPSHTGSAPIPFIFVFLFTLCFASISCSSLSCLLRSERCQPLLFATRVVRVARQWSSWLGLLWLSRRVLLFSGLGLLERKTSVRLCLARFAQVFS